MKTPNRITWMFLMLIILLTNGMSSFGLKVLTSWGVPDSTKFPYLTVWYAAGFVLIAIPMLLKGVRGGLKEASWGALIAALSIGGQLAMASALGSGLSGSIVFPVTIGGSILVVVLAGSLFFAEKLHPLSWAGIAIGFLAVVLLSVS
jgi:drug/metabolite transporter (DMT)-like permease